jgi:transposase
MDQEQRPKGRKARKRYTEEFKRSVVDHWLNSGKTGTQVAQAFGVKIWNLRDWKREYGPSSKPLDAPLPKTPDEMTREIQQLRKELARVTMQRDILKKTMGILSEE